MSPLSGPLAGLSRIASNYDVILSDVWGVLHNGRSRTPGADEALAAFRSNGGRVVLITNAPVPADRVIDRLNLLDVTAEAYDGVVSSGDVTRTMLAPYRGKVVHYVGSPDLGTSLYDGLELVFGEVDEAEVVLVADLESADDTPEMYLPRMRKWLERGLPLICANPDKVVERGERVIYCGGAIADLYAEAGGEVLMAGKPYAPIYEEALRVADREGLSRTRVLAIGDSARTDATGAATFGLDFLFIAGAIHAADFGGAGATPQAVRDLLAPTGARTVGYTPRLAW